MLNKTCTKCGENKPAIMFNVMKAAKTGLAAHCRLCKSSARKINADAIAMQKKAWYEENKAVTLAVAKKDREDNPDKHKAKEAAKYIKNKDKIKARVLDYQKRQPDVYRRAGKKYREANPHLSRAKAAKRRAVKVRATPAWASSEWEQFFIAEIYHLAQLRDNIGQECHVDHTVPLTSDLVCGLHCAANLRILPARENESKGNRYWPDMP